MFRHSDRVVRLFGTAIIVGVAISLPLSGLATSYASTSMATGRQVRAEAPSTPGVTATPLTTLAPIPRNKPVAIVAGVSISGADYADLVAQQLKTATLQAQQQGTTPPTEKQVRVQVLTVIIDTAMINHYAQTHGLGATQKEIDQQYATISTQTVQQAKQNGQTVTFLDVLKEFGYTEASFRQTIANNIMGGRVVQLKAPPGLIDAVRARHILIGPTGSQTATAATDAANKAAAEAIYKQLQKDPSQFATIARQKSTDTGSGAQGGELGWFVRGMMVAPFEQAAFSLRVGQISQPVKSQFGYHIIQVEEHRMVPFTKLPQSAQQLPAVQILVQKQQTQFQAWLTSERVHDHVRVLYQP